MRLRRRKRPPDLWSVCPSTPSSVLRQREKSDADPALTELPGPGGRGGGVGSRLGEMPRHTYSWVPRMCGILTR